MKTNVTAETARRIEEAAFGGLLAGRLEQARAELQTTTLELAEARKKTTAIQDQEYSLIKRVDLLRALVLEEQAGGNNLWATLLANRQQLGIVLAIALKDSECLSIVGGQRGKLVVGTPKNHMSLGTLQEPKNQARIRVLLERLAGALVDFEVVGM